ncbi:GNAT family N-acetyltransferase [Vicingaceae bacterium]|nr:GNAT family N-acetyltransferase [Vicingaceae bacterium]
MEDYRLIESVPSVDDFCRIRIASGLSPRSKEIVAVGLPNSLFGVHAVFNQTTIGMGRVIGDGGCNFEVVDIAVLPEHQGRGIGKMIMERIMAFLQENAPPTSYISLIGDVPEFYVPFGFKDCKPSKGMFIRVP